MAEKIHVANVSVIANLYYDYVSIRFNRCKMFQFCERKSTFSFKHKHKVIFTDKVLRYFKIDIGIIKIPRLYIFFYFTRLPTVLVDALPGGPDPTPSMGEMTWSPVELVVHECERQDADESQPPRVTHL